ncbi:class I SAM-dependent methyltransferase [Chitinophaga lutea]
MKVNERFNWAVEMLHVQPDDHILEIGCGHGIAVSLIAPELKSGSITAVDTSPAMIEKASRRNETAGAAFLTGTFPGVDLPDKRFDKIFAFNVNVFFKDAGEALTEIRQLLAPLGALYVFQQPPPTTDMRVVEQFAGKIGAQLKKNSFVVKDVLYKRIDPSPCVCVIAQPSAR